MIDEHNAENPVDPQAAQREAEGANEAELRRRVGDRIDDLADAARLIAAGTATPQQQRDALALALLTCARLARLVLADRLDAVE
jgi:hypothetical protein